MHPNALLDLSTELLRAVLKLDQPADAVVSAFFRRQAKLGARERHALAETTYHVLRHRLRLQHLAQSGSGAIERRLAILGWQGTPGVLQSALGPNEQQWLQHVQALDLSTMPDKLRHNLPDWIAAPLRERLGEEEFMALAGALNEAAPLDLRVNLLKSKREDALAALQAAGIAAQPTPYSPWGLRVQGKPALNKLEVFTSGAVEVQDEGSQLLALLVAPKRGEMVVDFCAGAGGKTLALGAAMRNTGRLYAFDVSGSRLDALKPRLARSGLSNVYPAQLAHERDERVKRLAGKIDRVLVDAPCSGLGTLRRNPDLKWRQSPLAVQELHGKQAAILASAARLVKSGGRLVYATCSLLPTENEDIAREFSAAHPEYEPLDAAKLLAQAQVPQAEDLVSEGFLRLWPHRHATDGFFAAVWQRR
ncbi:RsmB/NOP family class I SAM-dependent RNA methyltransferase [uncultured Azohydromonas sp.]|jgi:tRNA and rRNA cytosine-C5-methylases|uniref:RsmB/NOP family class I SAM-dependent RNA methyltransferase n=1 Tax=uncultured Azohydromonas sp. TaxID=487342 RepID=UPI002616F0C0|nr:RsmB/NOP family class I SAM-dependent RNA methyltransferase [uncultured Azohydromonas sp.]